MNETVGTIDLLDLTNGAFPEISTGLATHCMEAACVSLEYHSHDCADCKLHVSVTKDSQTPEISKYRLTYPLPNEIVKNSNNDSDATEYGAYGISLLLLKKIANYQFIEQSSRYNGFDFYLKENDAGDDNIFAGCVRLEVSGIRKGTQAQINTRVKGKLSQISVSDIMNTPKIVSVVEFSKPKTEMVFQ